MSDIYQTPITKEYSTCGCNVKIDAASNPKYVLIEVRNINTGDGSVYTHTLLDKIDNGYSNKDMTIITQAINSLLDKYGDSKWEKIYSTNQILS